MTSRQLDIRHSLRLIGGLACGDGLNEFAFLHAS